MIVFYTENRPTIQLSQTAVCDSICSANCITPKSKCCNKYKKKGINWVKYILWGFVILVVLYLSYEFRLIKRYFTRRFVILF